MQTFMTRKSFHKSMKDLDDKRLRNQFEEAMHLLRVKAGLATGYEHHPAALMWNGYEHALDIYVHATVQERVRRWGKRFNPDNPTAVDPWVRMDEVSRAFGGYKPYEHPPWMDDLWFLTSHRSNLIRKDAAHYAPLWTQDVPELMPYLWPIISDEHEEGYFLQISRPDAKRLKDGDLFLPEELVDTRELVYK